VGDKNKRLTEEARAAMWLKKIKQIGLILAWLLGMMMAGSDSLYMPWPNIAGMVLFVTSSWRMSRYYVSTKRTDLPYIKRYHFIPKDVVYSESADQIGIRPRIISAIV
jgi:hypothetical protein